MYHFIQRGFFLRGKRFRIVRHIIWRTVVRSLWLARNKVIFQGGPMDLIHVLAQIKMTSWGWFIYIGMVGILICLFRLML